MKGGYKIIDLKDNNFTLDGDAITIKGVYDSVENSHRKATLLSGLVIDNVEKPNRFVTFTSDSGSFVTTMADAKITITAEDTVTLASV